MSGESGLPPEKKRPKTALVLSGGGAWGISHIGAIKVIEEIGIPVDIVVGTSMGSILGGLFAAGYSADELISIIESTDWMDIFNEEERTEYMPYLTLKDNARYAAHVNFDKLGFFLPGALLTGEKILRFLDAYLIDIPSPVNFDNLKREFRAVATDLSTGEPVVISNGSLPDAMRASMSIPGAFTPWLIEDRYCIDGGVVDNLPIDLARTMGADIIIAVDLLDTQSYQPKNIRREPFSALRRTVDIFTRNNVEKQLPNADLVISVDMQGIMIMEFNKSKELYALGEAAAREKKEALENMKAAFFADEEENGLRSLPVSKDYSSGFPGTPTRPQSREGSPLYPKPPLLLFGATDRDYKRIMKLYDAEDFSLDLESMKLLFEEIDRTGRYNSIRMRRNSLREGAPLLITLSPKPQEDNAVRLSFSFDTTLSDHNSMGFNLTPGVVLYGLTTRTSRLAFDLELFSTPGFEMQFMQPLNEYISLKPFFTWQHTLDNRFSDSYMGDNVTYINTGLDFAAVPFSGTTVGIGGNVDHVDTEYGSSENIDDNFILHSYFSFLRIDSPIFPMKGFAAFFDHKMSLYQYDSDGFFNVFKTEGFTAIHLGLPVSFALRWKGGTDFSFTSSDRAPFFYLPTLSSRWLFPGSLTINEETGSHVLGFGLEAKYRINWIILPFYALIHLAEGAVIQDAKNISWDSVFHWNASLGVGVRINHGFGIVFRGGVHQGIDKRFSPYFALDVGALGLF
jgi:NTE family protein